VREIESRAEGDPVVEGMDAPWADFPGLVGPLRLYREGVRSLLCVPVFAQGRLVGTINLESLQWRGFDGSAHAVEEYAQLVGLAFVLARREISVEMLEAAEGFLDRRHAIEGEIVEALRILNETDERHDLVGVMRTAEHSVARARALIRQSSKSATVAERPERTSIGRILEEECLGVGRFRGVELSLDVLLLDDSPAIRERVETCSSSACEPALRFALRQVVANALDHGLKSGSYRHKRPTGWKSDIAVCIGQTRIGGRDNIVIGVENVAVDLDESTASKIFREPLEQPWGRVCLGAFLTGEALRRCGGAATFRIDRQLNEFTVVAVAELSVPIDDP